LAEYLRHDKKSTRPRVSGVEYVAFDDAAAEILGSVFPMAIIMACRTPAGPKDYIKYDAMIVACAKRWNADCIVTLDGHPRGGGVEASGIFRLAAFANVAAYYPAEFQAQQIALPLPTTAVPPAQDGDAD